MYNTDLPNRAELPSTARLLRSTALAAIVAGGLLITTILPAEYGIDPTGIGRALGLTPMGEIKMSLATEALAEADTAVVAPAPQLATPMPMSPGEDTRSAVSEPAQAADVAEAAEAVEAANSTTVTAAVPTVETAPAGSVAQRRDTMSVTLKPGEAAEIKLTMEKDKRVRFEWTTAGGAVNYDTHGDPPNAPRSFYHGYGKGRNQLGDVGELQAAFDGYHGWFWRNRSNGDVTVTLNAEGEYSEIKRVL
ncbi:transmembrane anchor protein [Rhodocyclaceae bacterium SMB388]